MGDAEQQTPGQLRIESERMKHVFSMVKKKANAALSGQPGVHFRVYPPWEYLQRPEVIEGAGVYEQLKGTVWWVRWYDESYDQLTFIEFVAFIDQIIETKRAFERATNAVTSRSGHRQSKHAGGWQPKKDRSGKAKSKPIRVAVEGVHAIPDLVADDRIRSLFSVVDLESTARPSQAMN
jgi:hypothetical protein